MPTYHEKKILPYSPQQLFELVADVEKYQEFLPWCVGSRIHWRERNQLNADVDIGYAMFRETFNSTVTLTPHEKIEVEYQRGPFTHLQNRWEFREAEQGCEVEFFIDFVFQSGMLGALMEPFFAEATHQMIAAFEKRAAVIYPSPNFRCG
jgi:coenzyme Q-binding protein COQ10